MKSVRFGNYRTTSATVWRPTRTKFEPAFELEDAIFEDLRAVERADQDLRRFSLDKVAARRLVEDALARNAYGTASIEGSPLSLEDVKSLLERGPTPEAMQRPEEREILNYGAYMERLPRWHPPRKPDEFLELHRELFAGVLDDAGSFKQQPNFIGNRATGQVVFVPAMPERVRPELKNAVDWFQDATEHPLIRLEVFFHEFQGIHPFRDGNGRTGRAVSTLQLHSLGYEGARFALIDYEFNADREAYYAALAAVERSKFDYTVWIRYMSQVLRRTFEGAVRRFVLREKLPSSLNDRQGRLAEWFARLSWEKPKRRVKFNDIHAAFPALAPRTLKRDLTILREAGVLEMEGERKAASYRLREPIS